MPAVPANPGDTTAALQLRPISIKSESEENTSAQEPFQAGPPIFSGGPAGPPQQLKRFAPPLPKKENNTGLPDGLKAGLESLSGFSMDDVKVHYQSDRPAQLQAFAYAQGNDIHVGPGQEKHLAHEAWHVVQQKQGRVDAITQLKGFSINNSPALEQEADQMGKLMTNSVQANTGPQLVSTSSLQNNPVVQRKEPFDTEAKEGWDSQVESIVQAIWNEYDEEVKHEVVEDCLANMGFEDPRGVFFELDDQDELDDFLSKIAEVSFEDVYNHLNGINNGDGNGEFSEDSDGGNEARIEDSDVEESDKEELALDKIEWGPELEGSLKWYENEGWWIKRKGGYEYEVANHEGIQAENDGSKCLFLIPANDIHKTFKEEIERCGVKLTAIGSNPYDTELPGKSEERLLSLQNQAYSLKNQPKESKQLRYKPKKINLDYKVKWNQKAAKFKSSNQGEEFRQSLDVHLGKKGPIVPGDDIHRQMFQNIAIKGNKVEVKFSIAYRTGKQDLQLQTGASHHFSSGKNVESSEKHDNADRIASMLVDSGQLESVDNYNDEKHSHSEQSMVVELSQTTDVFNKQLMEIIKKAKKDNLEICALIIDMFSSPNTVCDQCYPSLVTLLTQTDWKDLVIMELNGLLVETACQVDNPPIILRVSSNTRYRGRANWKTNENRYAAKTSTGVHFIEKAPAEHYY